MVHLNISTSSSSSSGLDFVASVVLRALLVRTLQTFQHIPTYTYLRSSFLDTIAVQCNECILLVNTVI